MPNKNPLQESDDKFYMEQPGSNAGTPETLINQDSPSVVSEVNTGNAKEGIMKMESKGTRNGQYDVVGDKDKNLREQFIQK